MAELYDVNAKLCRAVKAFPCIYDREHPTYLKKDVYESAWEAIAKQCDDSSASCKVRWRNIRTAFIRSVQGTPKRRTPNRTREYYLHDVLEFYLPHLSNVEVEKPNDSDEELEPPKKKTDSEANKTKETSKKTENTKDDAEATTSAEETADDTKGDEPKKPATSPTKSKVKTFYIKEKPSKVGTFIIKKIPDGKDDKKDDSNKPADEKKSEVVTESNDATMRAVKAQEEEGKRRFRFRRACKRGLDKTMVKELRCQVTRREPEIKRQRRTFIRKQTLEKLVVLKARKSVSPTTLQTTEQHEENVQNEHNEMGKIQKKPTQKEVPEAMRQPELVEAQLTEGATVSDSSHADWLRSFENYNQLMQLQNNVTQDPHKETFNVTVMDQAVQCSLMATANSAIDDDFLRSLKPHMAEMNARQKLHFKKKIYESLMEVFDNAADFPEASEILSAPTTLPASFATTSTTNEEMRLIRELVSLVQAAKQTPELTLRSSQLAADKDADIAPVTEASDNQENDKTPLDGAAVPTAATPPNFPHVPSFVTHAPNCINEIPQHIIRKVMKASGGVGATLTAHDGDRRRIYRIFPRSSLPLVAQQNAAAVAASGGSGVGTFIIPRTAGPGSVQTPLSSPSLLNWSTVGAGANGASSSANKKLTSPPFLNWTTKVNANAIDSGITSSKETDTQPQSTSNWPAPANRQITENNAASTSSRIQMALQRSLLDNTSRQMLRRYSVCGTGTISANGRCGTPTKIITTTANAVPSVTASRNAQRIFRSTISGMDQMRDSEGTFKIPHSVSTASSTATLAGNAFAFLPAATQPVTMTPTTNTPTVSDTLSSQFSLSLNASSTSSPERSVAKRASRQKPNASVEKSKKEKETKSPKTAKNDNEKDNELQTAGTISSDNFNALNIKSEPMDDSL